ncbi:MAG TPA: class I poly(R)-hydroxyalkanoic acid synthase [Dongiaceae bacterium]|nr:class I poly(R)-hydroxyalkanoic acid synthase [Dongiaceae bacterium]
MGEITETSQRLIAEYLARQGQGQELVPVDASTVGKAFLEWSTKLLAEPEKLIAAQCDLWSGYLSLWESASKKWLGEPTKPVITPAPEDRRFRDEAWQNNQLFDFIKQSYLLTSRWLQDTVKTIDGLDPKTAQKVEFYTRQFIDALAPSNFALTNPEVLRATLESRGENLLSGLRNLLEDLERGQGQLAIRMTDLNAFAVGRNLAVTPGAVVYQNDLMQLIQYQANTSVAARRPLLIVPPWINKYYILDMKPENSFVKWAVEQGHTVFIISWVNPDEKLAQKSFADYMREGPIDALRVIADITSEPDANVIGYCLGGTLLACTLSYLNAKNESHRIASATFLTTLIDYSAPGEIEVFIDEEQIRALEEKMDERGYLEGSEMATTFNLLRANDLIWSFVINNYLLGKEPFPFDLLYWNSDSTRLPAAMHSFYLRNMYQRNLLVRRGGIELDSVPIDLYQIRVPSFLLSTREDHIAPWRATYAATQIYAGPVTFVLAASGHIAGIVNPPAAKKYSHWVHPGGANPADPDRWFAEAEARPGSWWPEWQAWITPYLNGEVAARGLGSASYPRLEPAPGSYVKIRLP